MQRGMIGMAVVSLCVAGSVMAQTPGKAAKAISQKLNTDYVAFEAESGDVRTEMESPNRWMLSAEDDASGGKVMQGATPNGRVVHETQSLLVFRLKFNKAGSYNLFMRDRVTDEGRAKSPKREESWIWFPVEDGALMLNTMPNHPRGWVGMLIATSYDWRNLGRPLDVTEAMVGKVQELRLSNRLDGYILDRLVLSTLGAAELQEKFGTLDDVPASPITAVLGE